MATGLAFAVVFFLGGGDAHDELNPVFRDLTRNGVQFAPQVRVALPPPTIADSVPNAKRLGVVKELIGANGYSFDEMLRKSFFAPELWSIEQAAGQADVYTIHACFIAYGDLKTISSSDFIEKLLKLNGAGGARRGLLSAADLAKRGIVIADKDKEREEYGRIRLDLVGRIRLEATGHSCWSECPGSILLAMRVDERFRDDPQFPNRWQALGRNAAGQQTVGEPQPYPAAAFYLKVTQLPAPERALFVELRAVYAEPTDWFGGANMLRSRFPPALQSQVRDLRRQLERASAAK